MTTPQPRVVHCKKEKYDVYIGRPGKWGNPYVIGLMMNGHPATREEVIEYSRDYFLQEIEEGRLDISELKGKTLGCYCAPKPCHGDVLLELANA